MKITIKEDGSIIIDGEHNTLIQSKNDCGYGIKIQGNNAHFFTEFIKIYGDKENSKHEIKNFVFKSISDELSFGDDLIIEGQRCLFIGIQNGKKIFWNTEKNQLAFGYAKNDKRL